MKNISHSFEILHFNFKYWPPQLKINLVHFVIHQSDVTMKFHTVYYIYTPVFTQSPNLTLCDINIHTTLMYILS